MRLFLSAAILLVALTQAWGQNSSGQQAVATIQASTPEQQAQISRMRTQAMTADQLRKMQHDLALQRGSSATDARQTVLVVPTPDLNPDALAAVTEDLTVMCRIFKKSLGSNTRSVQMLYNNGQANVLGRLLLPQTERTQALYLDGYGAVFFIPVDFPLVPPAQEKAPAQPQPQNAGDELWSQTVNELHGQQDETTQGVQAGPAYDAQRVESLKNTLIQALRHAANIRTRRPQDYIVLAVGTQTDGGGGAFGNGWAIRDPQLGPARWQTTTTQRASADLTPDPAATLILRVVKADIDALAAGQLTNEQFNSRVQTFWSSVPPEAPASAPATSK
jgi:hypothetical protein